MQSPSLTRARAPLKSLVACALLVICGPGALAKGTTADVSQSSAPPAHNSDAPVNYSADHIELLDKQDRVLLTGNVDITQDDLRLRSARSVVAYTKDGGVKIQRLDATGDVLVTRSDQTARGDVATYDFNRRIITMVGNVVLHRGSDVLYGARLVIDLKSGLSSVDGHGAGTSTHSTGPSGRVSGSFAVPKHKG